MSNFPVWMQGLIAAFIGGAANAGLNYLGLATAKGMGLDVPVLNWKALGMMLVVGGLISLFAFLKASPVPVRSTTQITVTKEETKPSS